MNIYISHSSSTNYEAELYKPIRDKFGGQHSIFFPHSSENTETKAKEIIAKSDLVIAEVSLPSTGQGIELGWADAAGVKIFAFNRKGSATSTSLKFINSQPIEYDNSKDLLDKIEASITLK